jgi:hemerythrin-like domain-containing protein
LHHPKEDAWLFRKLRERTHAFDDTLAELERQHVEGRALVDELEQSIAACEADPESGRDRFDKAVTAFVSAQERHMRLETRVVLPAAFEHLTPEDWNEIGRAFSENGDPRFSADTDEEFRQLFARILNLMPAPCADGPPRT